MGVLGALSARATLVYLTRFDPALHLELLESERATITCGVPTMFIAMLGHPDSTSRLEQYWSGSLLYLSAVRRPVCRSSWDRPLGVGTD